MKPVAIVIPWFGRELKGGAEQHAWQMAARLAARGHSVEVLTTCCASAQEDWSVNHLPPGVTREPEGFSVRRFPVNGRKRSRFRSICKRLWDTPLTDLKPGVSPLSPADAAKFSEMIHSARLLDYLRQNTEAYHAYVFIPYLYGPILNGLPLVASRAWLHPCLHDEAYAYLPPVAEVFRHARGILFLSEGECELARHLYGPGLIPRSVVVGGGVEVPEVDQTPARAGARFPFGDAPYVLCLGRKEAGKNSPMLLRAFQAHRTACPDSRLKLVFAGIGSVALDGLEGHAFDLGVVPEPDKLALLDGCLALLQPSRNESFSRVIMEAWRRERPVVVHRDCLATATAVRRCGGGWLAGNEGEWCKVLAALERAPGTELKALGSAGRAYAREAGDWQKALGRYETALFGPATPPTPAGLTVSAGHRPVVHQLLHSFALGDAISNSALWIRDTLRQAGAEAEIFALHFDPTRTTECRRFSPGCFSGAGALLYHHSIGSELTARACAHPGPKCLLYHNITPAEFFEPFCPAVARSLREGREELRLMAGSFLRSVGDSTYNAGELLDAGFSNPGVLPLVIDPAWLSTPPDPSLMEKLKGGQTNLIFVGRMAPNKKHADLIRLFRDYLRFDPNAVLHLIGDAARGDPYPAYLEHVAARLGLRRRVNFPGKVTPAQLAAYYRTAHLFWSMSEHEGFCVPLVEAMWFDVPVLAFKSSAVPETLADAGLMFTDKRRSAELAALASLLVHDEALRSKVTARQRQRRACFLPSVVTPQLLALVGGLLNGAKAGPVFDHGSPG